MKYRIKESINSYGTKTFQAQKWVRRCHAVPVFLTYYFSEKWEDMAIVSDPTLEEAKERIDRYIKSLNPPVYHDYP